MRNVTRSESRISWMGMVYWLVLFLVAVRGDQAPAEPGVIAGPAPPEARHESEEPGVEEPEEPEPGSEERKKGPPHVEAAWLEKVDRPQDIEALREQPAAVPAARVLKPRIVPGFERMKSAIWNGSANLLDALLQEGGDPNAVGHEGQSLLGCAVWMNRSGQVEILLDAGADPNFPDGSGNLPLANAVWHGNRDVVQLLLKYGADPNRKDRRGTTAFDRARSMRRPEIVELLEEDRVPPVRPRGWNRARPQLIRRPARQFGTTRFRIGSGGKALVYTPDGRMLIAGGSDGAIRLFDAQTGLLERVFLGHDRDVLGLALIPDSPVLVSAGEDKTVRFWDLRSFTEVRRLRCHWGQGKALSVSPDGRFLNTGLHVWEISSADPLELAHQGRMFIDPEQPVAVLWSFFTPDSRYLVLSKGTDGLWLWDLQTDRIRLLTKEHPKPAITWNDLARVADVGIADRDRLLALVKDQYTMLTGPPETLEKVRAKLKHFDAWTQALALSPDGRILAAISHGCCIKRLDLELGKLLDRGSGHTAGVLAVAFSPDGRWLASGGNDQMVRVWNLKTGKEIRKFEIGSFVYCVRFSPDGEHLAIGDNGGRIHLWSVEDDSFSTIRAHSARVTDLAFDRKHQLLASVAYDARIHLLDLKSRKPRLRIRTARGSNAVAVCPDFRLLVTDDVSMRSPDDLPYPLLWPLEELLGEKEEDVDGLHYPGVTKLTTDTGHGINVVSLDFSPDGALLAAGSWGLSVLLWDWHNRSPAGKLCGHTGSVCDVEFSPDGKWLASGGWDGTARIWQPSTGRQLAILDADVYRINGLAFSPDGKHLATANFDGTVHLWSLPGLTER